MDTLKKGSRFRSADGRTWTLVRAHGSHVGSYVVRGSDGQEDAFAGAADVEPLSDTGWENAT